jgi:hypothetical protein
MVNVNHNLAPLASEVIGLEPWMVGDQVGLLKKGGT